MMLLVKILLVLFFQISCIQASIFNAVINSMEEENKVFCVLMMSSMSQGYTSYDVPVMGINFHDPPKDIKATSNLCMHHIIILKNTNELNQINKWNLRVIINMIADLFEVHLAYLIKNSFQLGDTKWALILQEKSSINEIENLLIGAGNFFEQMADVAIYNRQAKDHYSVLARDPTNEDKIKCMDIWKNGNYMFGKAIYPKNRLSVSNTNQKYIFLVKDSNRTSKIRISKEKSLELQHSIEVQMLWIMAMVLGQGRK